MHKAYCTFTIQFLLITLYLDVNETIVGIRIYRNDTIICFNQNNTYILCLMHDTVIDHSCGYCKVECLTEEHQCF